MIKTIRRLLIAFLILLVIVIGTTTFLLYSNTGLRVMVSLIEKVVPQLNIAQIDGQRITDLSLKQVSYTTDELTFRSEQVDLLIEGRCLLKLMVCISKVALNDTTIDIKSSETPPPPSDTPFVLSLPVPVVVSLIDLNVLTLNVDDVQVKLDQLLTGFNGSGSHITLYPTELKGVTVSLPNEVASSATPIASSKTTAEPLGKQLETLFSQPLLSDLPEVILPLTLTIEQFIGQDWSISRGNETYAITQLQFKGSLLNSDISIDSFSIDSPLGTAKLSGDVQLQGDWATAVEGEVLLTLEPEWTESLDFSLKGEVMDTLTLAVKGTGAVDAVLNANLILTKEGLPLTLSLVSDKVIQWPFVGNPEYQLQAVNLLLSGSASRYTLQFNGILDNEMVNKVKINLNGTGTLSQFMLSPLTVDLFDGKAELRGDINWYDEVKWNAALSVEKINTVKYLPDFPMSIDGNVVSTGFWKGDDWQLNVADVRLKGSMKKQPINVKGQFSGSANGQWLFDNVDATWGENHLAISGNIGNNIQVKSVINANDLGLLSPELSGSIVGFANVSGTIARPTVSTDIKINKLRWQTWTVNKASLVGNIVSDTLIQGDAVLNADKIVGSGVDLKQVNAVIKGSEANHTITVKVNGQPVGGELAASGHFDRQTSNWKGQLQRSKLNTPAGDWALQKQTDIMVLAKEGQVNLGAHCWKSEGAASLCFVKPAAIGSNGNAEIALSRFELKRLNKFIADSGINLNGLLNGQADVVWQASQGIPQINAKIGGKGITVTTSIGDQTTYPLNFDDIEFVAAMKSNVLSLDLRAQLAKLGKFSSQLNIADPQNKKGLSGTITIDQLSLGLARPFLSDKDVLDGFINGKMSVGGTLTDPLIFGQLDLTKGKIEGDWLPINITSVNMALKFTGKESQLTSKIITPDGALTLTGQANWQQLDNWYANATAKGDLITIDVPPMVSLKVKPDVQIKASATSLDLRGNIDIPWARITVESLPPSAIGVSSDEVILDDQRKPVTPKKSQAASMRINSDLRITIRDNVRIDAFGLTSRLQGVLTVKQDDKKGIGLQGQVNFIRGRFHSYGQDLVISNGNLIFSGPVDQPLLNIRAIRNPDSIANNVTAGVNVTGYADAPKIALFSDPAMSQQEILSYILRGQGLSGETGQGDSDMMTSLLIGLGASQGGKYIGQVGEMFGIKNVSLDTQGFGNSSQVVVSGNIAPNIQLKYGMGIFDSLSTFTLRYRLMPRLYLEAVSSLDQAVGILYQFEF